MPNKPAAKLPLDAGVALQPGDIAFVTDRLGRLTWWNEEAASVFGLGTEETLGMPLDVVCGGLAGEGPVNIDAVLDGRDFAGGIECSRRDGERIALYAFATAGRDEHGEVAGVVFIARDVTGYWRAEEVLRTSEEKYRRLFEGSNDIVLVTDAAGRIEDANLAAIHLIGYTADELRALSLFDIVAPAGRRVAELAVTQMRQRGSTMSVLTFLTRTGKDITLETSTSIIRVGTGQKVLVIGRDITERQLAEQRVRESEHKYRRIFEASGDAILLATFEMRIIDCNDRACEMFGRTRPELLALHIGDLVAHGQQDWLPLLNERLVRTGQYRGDVSMLGQQGPGGRVGLTVDLTASLLDLADGPAVLCVGHDVSERRRAEAALRESEARYRTLRDNVPVGLFRTTPDGRFLSLNPAAVRIAGYRSEAEMLGVRVIDHYVDPAERDRLLDCLAREGRVIDAQVRMRRPDGTVYDAQLSVEVIDGPDGAVQYFDGAIQDVTERKRIAAELVDREARLRLLVEQLPTVLWTVDRELVFTTSMGAGLSKLGLVPGQIVGKSLFEYFNTSDPGFQPIAAHRRALEGEPARYEFEWNGETFDTALEPLRDTDGAVVGVIGLATDVTDERRREAELRASEERYRLLFESTTDSVAIADVDGRVLDANPACLRTYGYTAEEVRQMNLVDVVAPEAREEAVRAMADLAAGKSVSLTIPMVRKDGRRLTVDTLAFVGAVGGERRVFSFTRDVTERMKIEAARRASEERYRKLAENLPDAIYIVGRDGVVRYCNGAGATALGRPGEALAGHRVSDLFPPAIAERQAGNLRKVFESGESLHIEGPSRYGDRKVWLSTWLVGLRDDAGVVSEVLGVSRDLSERKRAEDDLRESEARYRAIFETTAAATIIIEADTTISLVNQEFHRLFGYEIDEVVGRSWTEFVAEEDLERLRSYHELRRSEDPVTAPRTYEAHLINKRGAVRDCLLTVDVIAGTGRSVASILDITERKRVEADLLDSERRFRNLFQSVPVGLYRTAPDGRILLANRALIAMLGFDSWSELRSRSLEDGAFGPGESRAAFRAAVECVDELLGWESTWRRKDGSLIHVRESARAVRDAAGTVQYYEGTAEDVTATRRALDALEESERNFRALAENSGDAIGITQGSSGRFVYVNERVSDVTGYDRAELLEMSFTDVVTPEVRRMMVERLRSRVAGGIEPRTYETTVLRKDGTPVAVELSVAVTTWHGETATIAAVRDIGERKAAAEALRASEAKYRSVVERASDGICVVRAGEIRYLNRRLAEMAGYAPDELIGKRFVDYLHPDDRVAVLDRYRRRLAGEEVPGIYRARFVTRAGETVTIEVNAAVAEYDGEPADIVLVRDVGERERILSELETARGRYESLLQSIRDGVVTFDTDGRIAWVNETVEKRTGLPAEFWRGRHFSDMAPPDQRKASGERFDAVMRGETVEPYEIAFAVPGSGTIYIEANPAAIKVAGSIVGSVLVLRDISERKAAAEALSRSEQDYRRALDAMPDAATVMDAGLNILIANSAMLAWLDKLGLDRGIVGKNLREAFPFLDEVVAEEYRRVIENSEPLFTTETTTVGSDVLTTETTKVPIVENGRVVRVLTVVHDTTERQLAGQRLRESEERYRRLVDLSPDIVAVHQAGRIVFANPATARTLGYTTEELAGRPILDLLHPEDRPKVAGRVGRVLESGEEAPPLIERFIRKDGSAVRVEARASAFLWQGRPAVLVVARRIEDVDLLLRESEERYRRLVDLSPNLIAVHQQGRVVFANPTAASVLGYASPEEAVGRPVIEFVHPDDRSAVAARIRRVTEDGEPAPPAVERFIRKDGSLVRVEVRNSPFQWDGKPAVLVVARDLSDPVLRAQIAEGAAAEAGDVLDRAPHGIAAVLNGLVVHANRRFCELFGYQAPMELTGTSIEELLEPEGRPAALKKLAAAARGKVPGFEVVCVLTKSGETAELEMAVVDYAGVGFEYSLWFARRPGSDRPQGARKPRARRPKQAR